MDAMITVKHFMDPVDVEDGQRIWVEPIGLTRDLAQWCDVHFMVPEVGPPPKLWEWFEEHPDGYEFFRARYHEILSRQPLRDALQHLANITTGHNITLLHQGSDPQHNTAAALYEFISILSACSPPGA